MGDGCSHARSGEYRGPTHRPVRHGPTGSYPSTRCERIVTGCAGGSIDGRESRAHIAHVTFKIEFEGVPVSIETDPETGEVTAYNDDLRVMAIAKDADTARRRFLDALGAQVRRDLNRGRPLNPHLRERTRARERPMAHPGAEAS